MMTTPLWEYRLTQAVREGRLKKFVEAHRAAFSDEDMRYISRVRSWDWPHVTDLVFDELRRMCRGASLPQRASTVSLNAAMRRIVRPTQVVRYFRGGLNSHG